ncbi:winged helix-turn-helix transcriptional regulator [Faecalibacter macacae]|nr:winged helix-turn-helix transcriptional regulator [Faecalibacter macacae]
MKRIVLDTQPVTVEYQLTEYGWSLQNIIKNLAEWGKEHRKVIIEK